MKYILFILSFLIFKSTVLRAQDPDEQSSDGQDEEVVDKGGFGFHSGFYVGPYFANKFTADIYNGYGYDFEGKRNSFEKSFIANKILYEYGGGNGQPDRIAQALNVNPGEWAFDITDMPVNLKYNPAFNVGIQTRFNFNNKSSIIFNANATKLTVNGDFTIQTINSQQVSGQATTNIKTFSIKGTEQRIVIQLGYQQLLGKPDKLNIFIEGGLNLNMVKFDKNEIVINSLTIDLTTFYNQQGYQTYKAKNLTGIGPGVFGGLGFNLSTGKKWTVQLLYSPSYDQIRLGTDPVYTLQHNAGFRAYYNF